MADTQMLFSFVRDNHHADWYEPPPDNKHVYILGFNSAVVDIIEVTTGVKVRYDVEKILQVLQDRDNMTYDEALEYFDYNIAGSHMGGCTPEYVIRNEVGVYVDWFGYEEEVF